MPEVTHIETKNYYDNRFGNLAQELNEEEVIRWNAIEGVLKKLNLNQNITIADFGCGRGWSSKKLSAFGSVTGFDISEKAVENAKRSFPNINFVCIDAAGNLSDEDRGKYDVVVSSEVIEHLIDQKSYLKNIESLLKKDGKYIITTPNGNWFNVFYQGERLKWKQPIENWLKPSELSELASQVGLKEIKRETFNSEWIFDNRPEIKFGFLAQPILRKCMKALGIFKYVKVKLNKSGYGLNGIYYGIK